MKKILAHVVPAAAVIMIVGALLESRVIEAAQPEAAFGQAVSQQAFALGNSPIQPLPERIDLDARKVALGDRLFHDKRLSRDNTIACASCHDVSAGGVDGLDHSIGIGGGRTAVNSPTVLNSGFNFVQFWDGRAKTLEEQIDGPVHHPGEMGSNWQQIISKLIQDPRYISGFEAAYASGLQIRNIKDAIATYERSLITPNARFDRYLRGQTDALNDQERAGYELFATLGCISCHQGQNVGGNMFQKFGVVGDYFRDRGDLTQADYGRYNVTGDEDDIHVFKVPSLRNVELTAPYFHDGSTETLETAVQVMATYQLGQVLPASKVDQIVAFLKTLTGEQTGAAK